MADGFGGMGAMGGVGWMQNPTLLDPDMQAAMQRQMWAQSLMGQAGDVSPVRSPWAAAARAVQGLLGGYEMGQAQQQMQTYAQGSRQAMANLYGQMPVPQLPAGPQGAPTPPVQGAPGQGQPPGPQAAAGPPPGSGVAPGQPLSPKDAALAQFAQRESGNQNIFSKVPVPGYTQQQTGSGYYQIIPSTWAEGQQLAGIPASQQTPLAINATPEQQYAVASALYDKYGGRPWAQSAPTGGGGGQDGVFIGASTAQPASGPSAPASPPQGAPPSGVPGTVTDAQQAAAGYGMQMAQQYRQMAINAATSPYASVRAMAPQFMQQSLGFLQYGRYQNVGTTPGGQMIIYDRQLGKVDTAGAPLSLVDTPQGGKGTPTGQTVYPSGYAPIPGSPGGAPGGPGAPGGQPFVGDVGAARSSGVPTSPGNPYSSLPLPDQNKQLMTDRDAANKEVSAGDPEAVAARTQIINLGRMQQIANAHPEWFGTSVAARAYRFAADQANNPDLQEFENLQKTMIPAERMGAGITRVTNKDMSIFESMTPNVDLTSSALNNAILSHQRLAQQTLEANRFQHDYVNANGSTRGMQPAWDAYTNANPFFVQDQNSGQYVLNPNAQNRTAWFQANTDPNTGLLLPGSRAQSGSQPGSGTPPQGQPTAPANAQGMPSQNPAQYPNYTAHGSDGSTWRSNGQQWLKVQ